MSAIDGDELRRRRHKLMFYYQERQSTVDNIIYHQVNRNCQASLSSVGQIAGRSVTKIDSSSSKEARYYHNHMTSTKKEGIFQDHVNTVKKSETHPDGKYINKSFYASLVITSYQFP